MRWLINFLEEIVRESEQQMKNDRIKDFYGVDVPIIDPEIEKLLEIVERHKSND